MPAPFIRTPYNYDLEAASNDAAIPPDAYGESLTVQSQADDADINVLMRRYGLTGRLPENPRVPSYGDFSDITDFRSALEAVRDAEDAFMEFPAELRARFQNNPQLLLDFVSNDANIPEAIKLGLIKEKSRVEVGSAFGGVAPQGNVAAPQSGGGAAAGAAGVGVSQQSVKSG